MYGHNTMPDVLGEILRRLDALEGAVHGKASKFFNRKLSKSQVALREGNTTRNVDRKVKAGILPPPDGYDNGHPFWWLSTLETNDRVRADLPTIIKRPSNAGNPAIRRVLDTT
jgi:hypothetical protein